MTESYANKNEENDDDSLGHAAAAIGFGTEYGGKVKKIRQLYNEAQNTAQYKDSGGMDEHGAWSLKFESMINYAAEDP